MREFWIVVIFMVVFFLTLTLISGLMGELIKFLGSAAICVLSAIFVMGGGLAGNPYENTFELPTKTFQRDEDEY